MSQNTRSGTPCPPLGTKTWPLRDHPASTLTQVSASATVLPPCLLRLYQKKKPGFPGFFFLAADGQLVQVFLACGSATLASVG